VTEPEIVGTYGGHSIASLAASKAYDKTGTVTALPAGILPTAILSTAAVDTPSGISSAAQAESGSSSTGDDVVHGGGSDVNVHGGGSGVNGGGSAVKTEAPPLWLCGHFAAKALAALLQDAARENTGGGGGDGGGDGEGERKDGGASDGNGNSAGNGRGTSGGVSDVGGAQSGANGGCPRETPTTDCLLVVVLPRGIP